jgi:hypothetical protein
MMKSLANIMDTVFLAIGYALMTAAAIDWIDYTTFIILASGGQ